MKLKPNCLLTRRPLVLIPAPKSLFFYKNPWGQLPEVLYQHGYKVNIHPLPFNKLDHRKAVLEKTVQNLNNCHVIVDEVTFQNLTKQLLKIEKASLTIITDQKVSKLLTPEENKQLQHNGTDLFLFAPPSKNSFQLNYELHRLWLNFNKVSHPPATLLFVLASEKTFYEFIDHCVHLAELDFTKNS